MWGEEALHKNDGAWEKHGKPIRDCSSLLEAPPPPHSISPRREAAAGEMGGEARVCHGQAANPAVTPQHTTKEYDTWII